VFVDVLGFAPVRPFDREPEQIHPERVQAPLVGVAHGNLLDPQDAEGTRRHGSRTWTPALSSSALWMARRTPSVTPPSANTPMLSEKSICGPAARWNTRSRLWSPTA